MYMKFFRFLQDVKHNSHDDIYVKKCEKLLSLFPLNVDLRHIDEEVGILCVKIAVDLTDFYLAIE